MFAPDTATASGMPWADHVVPGWPYSFVAVLTPDRTSWTQVLDAVRLGPTDDAAAVTAGQLRAVVERLVAVGQWQRGDRHILVVMDAGYDVMRLAWVLRRPKLSLKEYAQSYPQGGRPPRHGKEFSLARPASWPEPSVVTVNGTPRYGKAEARAWDRLHPRLQQRSAWIDHDSELPVIEGTLIRLNVDHLPGDRDAPPVWLWSSATGATPADVDFVWSC